MTAASDPIPRNLAGVRFLTELPTGELPLYQQPEFSAAFPWLVQGTMGRGSGDLDMGLFGTVPTGVAQARWRRLREVTGLAGAVHARQVHGAQVRWYGQPVAGLLVGEGMDGHATDQPGVLLTVAVADCVPILLVSPGPRAIALLHAGWRGVAAGVLEAGIATLRSRAAVPAARLHLHCGPAICGPCYEVGPEVLVALGLDASGQKQHLDLRAAIARRAVAAGIPEPQITISGHCTRCGEPTFWSHRGGCRERQLGVAGIRE